MISTSGSEVEGNTFRRAQFPLVISVNFDKSKVDNDDDFLYAGALGSNLNLLVFDSIASTKQFLLTFLIEIFSMKSG